MDFVEEIRNLLKVESRYKFSKILRKSTQSYDTLVAAKDRITFRDLIAIRRVSPLTDTQLLDLIEEELKSSAPETYNELPEGRGRKGKK
jgi:hypothetical protein